METKVVDIYPPEEEKKKSETGKMGGNKREGRKLGKLVIYLLLIFFFFGGYFYYLNYETKVVIYPELEKFKEERSVLIKALGPLDEDEVRGVVLSETISRFEEFPIKERRLLEEKTKGEIKVCQYFSESARSYVENTRFISDEGKLFYATKGFTLPGKAENGGCSLVSVIAAEAGEEYNISSDSKFALPGLEGTEVYGRVKGEEFLLKTEGYSKEVPYLGEGDMQEAETKITEELLDEGIKKIEDKHGDEYILESSAQYIIEVVERNFNEKEDDEDYFIFEIETRVKAIAISREDMDRFVMKIIPGESTWREETKDVSYNFSRVDFEDQEARAIIDFSLDLYEKIEIDSLKRDIIGLDFDSAKEAIKEDRAIKDVALRAFPFGLSNVVRDTGRIEVILMFDKN